MNILLSFRSELLKSKGTSLWYLLILLSLFIPFLGYVDYFHEANNAKPQGNPWGPYLAERFQLLNIVILPLFTILICTLFGQIEFRNNTWKQVLASPQKKYAIFFSKYAMVLLMIFLFVILHNIWLFVVTTLVDSRAANVWFKPHSPDWHTLMHYNLRTLVCVQGISALQFWLGIRFRNFVTPIGIGFGLWLVAAALTLELRLPRADLHPYTYPIYAFFREYEWRLPVFFAEALMFAALFLFLGFREFDRRSLKE